MYDVDMPHVERLSYGETTGDPVALILPGAGYPVRAPLLHWARHALDSAGYDVWTITWHGDIDDAARADLLHFVTSQLAAAEALLPSSPAVVVGKSLGCFALPSVVERDDVRAAWLTPILTDATVADALRRASEKHLAIGGTADPSWRPEKVTGTRAELFSVDGADHALEVPSEGWRVSVQGQTDALAALTRHLGL